MLLGKIIWNIALVGCIATSLIPERKRHVAYTRPLPLKQGEVSNQYHQLSIPPGPIAVYRFEADVVEKDENGEYIPVPNYDAYLHHHVVGSSLDTKSYEAEKSKWSPMKSNQLSRAVGFGAGTESRGTPQEFYFPYAFLTVKGEDSWVANVHVINTRGMSTHDAHRCLECPCTRENWWKNSKYGTSLPWNMCNAELEYQNNTGCFPESYHGGLRCCEDGTFCMDKTKLNLKDKISTYYLRYTIDYSEIVPENIPLTLASCCDASGDLQKHGAIEYDIPVCDPNHHPGCVHTLSTKQRIGGADGSLFGIASTATSKTDDAEVELLFAVGHQHRGGLGINLYEDKTNNLICSSIPKYGQGNQIVDEFGYIVSMSTCTFNPPYRMKRSDIVRLVSSYNNTRAHTGVMSLFYIAIAEVAPSTKPALSLSDSSPAHSSFTYGLLVVVAAAAVASIGFYKLKYRHGYRPLTSD